MSNTNMETAAPAKSQMESVGGSSFSSSTTTTTITNRDENDLENGLSEVQDDFLSIIEQQSNRSIIDESNSSALVPFGEILRDIYETSNQTLDSAQHHVTLAAENSYSQANIPSTPSDRLSAFHIPYPRIIPQQQVLSPFSNSNFMNFLNPLNFYHNYHLVNNAAAAVAYPPIYSNYHQNINNDYNQQQNIERLIETVYEDESDKNPVYLNFNVKSNEKYSSENQIHSIQQQSHHQYPVDQDVSSVVPTQQSFPNTSANRNSPNENDKKYVNRIIRPTTDYAPSNISNKTSFLHSSNPSAFIDPYSIGKNVCTQIPVQYQHIPKNVRSAFVTPSPPPPPIQMQHHASSIALDYNSNYLYFGNKKPNQILPIGKNYNLKPNQKFITPDMISCRPPVQTKQTVAALNIISKSQDLQLSSSSSTTKTTEANSSMSKNDDITEATDLDLLDLDFSSLDTSNIIISKIQPKLDEPLHKKRKQDFKNVETTAEPTFEYISFNQKDQQLQNEQKNHENTIGKFSNSDQEIFIEKSLYNFVNSSCTDDDIDNNNENFADISSSPLQKVKTKKINNKTINNKKDSNDNKSAESIGNRQQKRKLLKRTNNEINQCFDNIMPTTTSGSETDIEDFKNKSFKCNSCKKIFKSAKTLSTHRKRCQLSEEKNNEIKEKKQNDNKMELINKTNNSLATDNIVDNEQDDPNSYQVEYLESDTENYTLKICTNEKSTIDNKNDEANVKLHNLDDHHDDMEYNCSRRKTRSQFKRKASLNINYYESGQKHYIKKRKTY